RLQQARSKHKLDEAVTKEDQEILLTALRGWGALDENYVYKTNLDSSRRRGYEKDPGGGVAGPPIPSKPLDLHDLLKSGLWRGLFVGANHQLPLDVFPTGRGMEQN